MRRLSDVVLWTAVPLSWPRRLWLRIWTVLVTVANATAWVQAPYALHALPVDPDPHFPPSDRLADLWLERPTADPLVREVRKLVLHGDRVEIDRQNETGGWRPARGPEVFNPRRITLLAAAPVRTWSWRRRKAVDRPWDFTVGWDGQTWQLRGPWVLLAHLGSLAGWPEPP